MKVNRILDIELSAIDTEYGTCGALMYFTVAGTS